MSVVVSISVCDKLFLRDPLETELGKKIIEESIRLMDEIGFERFTFKKLAENIQSVEASIYRYFENKHKLLVYLVNWYWAWLEYRIQLTTATIKSAKSRLDSALKEISLSNLDDLSIVHVDESKLHRIVVRESSKTYRTMDVDLENTEGFFANYKSLCKLLSGLILENKPGYPFPDTLASTLIESAHQQLFFSQHLPRLTNINRDQVTVLDWLRHLTKQAIG